MKQGNQTAWWVREEPKPASDRPHFRAVAYYRHSARDRQENSVAIQQELVQKWAKENGVEIIHEFSDRGKSGLTAEGRDAFNDMMENWVKKRNDFEFVLCLDVSRWGRFQDIDLSATYSAECKRHGKQVIYTTLGMPRPDDPLYPVYVQFERFRAAQYSKELSAKVFHGCIKISQQGYWAGGKPPYGFERLLLDEARKPVQVLAPGQKKSIQNQRVTLTLGSDEQVTTVRRIFSEFIDAGHTLEQIADRLNRDGSRSSRGGRWHGGKIRRVLTNVMYAGTMVYNKTTSKLKTPTRRNPVEPECLNPSSSKQSSTARRRFWRRRRFNTLRKRCSSISRDFIENMAFCDRRYFAQTRRRHRQRLTPRVSLPWMAPISRFFARPWVRCELRSNRCCAGSSRKSKATKTSS
jgi:DNA invertase Pin-like site-specific DNA recombinase